MPKSYANIDIREWSDAEYEEIIDRFEWAIPDAYNVAQEICTDQPTDDVALRFDRADTDESETYTFGELDEQSSRLASWLASEGVERGDRIGIALSQHPDTPVAHLATYKLGAIAVPISVLTSEESIDYRVEKADVRRIFATETVAKHVKGRANVETLVTKSPMEGAVTFDEAVATGDPAFSTAKTDADDPFLITFTSGTSGAPKGVVHAHRCLASTLPTFELMLEFPGDDATIFTPADWAWIAGTLDSMFPTWWGGRTVIGYESRKFDPNRVFEVLESHAVTHAFLTPTMLRMLRDAYEAPMDAFDLSLEVVATGGESTTDALFEWIDEGFDSVSLNEHYGQSEADLLTTNSSQIVGVKPGSIGRPVPGHTITVIDDEGEELPTGEIGTLALKTPDPAVMLEYWESPARTEEAFRGAWLDTGDTGYRDEDGFFWFSGRGDDLIISSGYRISPTEVEQVLGTHEAVHEVVVVGTPDEIRGEVVTAIVVLADESLDHESIRKQLRETVRDQLAKYKYPRRIEFVDELPTTNTRKIDRQAMKKALAENS